MKKSYHYLYTLNDLEDGHPEMLDIDFCDTEQSSSFRDVFLCLDKLHFDVSRSVIRRLVEYAEKQTGNL